MKNLPILIIIAFALFSSTGCKKAVCVPEINKTDKSKFLSVRRSGNEIVIFNNSTSKVKVYYGTYYSNSKKPTYSDLGVNNDDRFIGPWLSKKYPLPSDAIAVEVQFIRLNCESYSNGEDYEYGYYSF